MKLKGGFKDYPTDDLRKALVQQSGGRFLPSPGLLFRIEYYQCKMTFLNNYECGGTPAKKHWKVKDITQFPFCKDFLFDMKVTRTKNAGKKNETIEVTEQPEDQVEREDLADEFRRPSDDPNEIVDIKLTPRPGMVQIVCEQVAYFISKSLTSPNL